MPTAHKRSRFVKYLDKHTADTIFLKNKFSKNSLNGLIYEARTRAKQSVEILTSTVRSGNSRQPAGFRKKKKKKEKKRIKRKPPPEAMHRHHAMHTARCTITITITITKAICTNLDVKSFSHDGGIQFALKGQQVHVRL